MPHGVPAAGEVAAGSNVDIAQLGIAAAPRIFQVIFTDLAALHPLQQDSRTAGAHQVIAPKPEIRTVPCENRRTPGVFDAHLFEGDTGAVVNEHRITGENMVTLETDILGAIDEDGVH